MWFLTKLTEGVSSCDETRCIAGDFDVVVFPSEKRGDDRLSTGMIKFQTRLETEFGGISIGRWLVYFCLIKDPTSIS